MAARSKAWVCGRSPAEIVGSNPTAGMDVCCKCCVMSGRGLCDGLITRLEESYRLWCVWVWSWILDNEVAVAHWGLSRHGKKKKFYTIPFDVCAPCWWTQKGSKYVAALNIITLDAGLLARSQYSEGPATGHLDTGFLGFPVSISKRWDGSQDSKLPLHASHVALPT